MTMITPRAIKHLPIKSMDVSSFCTRHLVAQGTAFTFALLLY